MGDKSGKIPKKKKINRKVVQKPKPIREIEYYLSQNGNDTKIIRDIAISSLIPKVESYRELQEEVEGNLLGFPFYVSFDEDNAVRAESNPYWSFTMMVKESGDHKLLFSSAEEAESLYTEILKE